MRCEFKVTAANQAGQSGFSGTVSAKPVGAPPIPPTIRAGAEPGTIWLSWACSLESQPAALWIEENRGTGWTRRPYPIWHSIGLCDQSYRIDTAWYSPGQHLQFRVVAERAGASSVSNVAGANVKATRAQFYLSLTEPNAASQQRFFAAKNNPGPYADYSFEGVVAPVGLLRTGQLLLLGGPAGRR
ncbi:hypothetical protein [Lentzea pudingi]|uniref:hypothetical protein n=1 Tax=Lentzea pudingi TaxID=1789439 RepID=UPI0016636489|nr:hypothetical protein [Lentzea pudingi]